MKASLLLIMAVALVGCEKKPDEAANVLFVEANKLISQAKAKEATDYKAAIADYEKALELIQKITDKYPETDLAVKLVSNQTMFTGEKRAQIKARMVQLVNMAEERRKPTLFELGNTAYKEHKLDEALEHYQAQVDGGRVSATLHFNLANAAFHDGQLGRAIFHYREAQTLSPRDEEVAHNLKIARDAVHNGTPPKTGLWRRLTGFLTLNEWSLLAAIPLSSWLAWLTAVNLRPAWRKRGAIWRPILGVVAIVLAVITLIAWRIQTGNTWVVTNKETTARFGPVAASPDQFKWFDGAELQIERTHNDWLLLQDATGRQGWVPAADVLQPGRPKS